MYLILIGSVWLLFSLVYFLICRPIAAEKRALDGTQNFDTLRRRQLFRLPMTAEQAEVLMKTENVWDKPRSRYENGMLTFTRWETELTYRISFLTDGNHTYLLLESPAIIKTDIPYFLTDYFRQKLHAEPVEITLLPGLKEVDRL